MVVVPADGRSDCRFVLVDGNGRLTSFDEKRASSYTSYANAGIYLLSRPMLDENEPITPIFLERELFPRWLREDRTIRAFIYAAICIDIGTSERYRNAQSALSDVEADTCTSQTGRQI